MLKSIFDKQILKKIVRVSNKKEYFRSNKSHHLTSSLTKYVFYNWLINNILYLCVT